MAVLAWWIFPALTTVVAICWAAWVRRSPRPRGDRETVEQHARFRAALAVPAAVGSAPVGSAGSPGSAADAPGNGRAAPTV